MGLGPPVCEDCRVIAKLEHPGRGWHCPVCNKQGHQLGNLWQQPDQEVYEQNTKFVDFVKGDK